jgi:hypothetical protein
MWWKLLAFLGVAIPLRAMTAVRISAFVFSARLLDLVTAAPVYFPRPNQSPSRLGTSCARMRAVEC